MNDDDIAMEHSTEREISYGLMRTWTYEDVRAAITAARAEQRAKDIRLLDRQGYLNSARYLENQPL